MTSKTKFVIITGRKLEIQVWQIFNWILENEELFYYFSRKMAPVCDEKKGRSFSFYLQLNRSVCSLKIWAFYNKTDKLTNNPNSMSW